MNKPDQHGFVLMGNDSLYIDHLPMFFMQDHMYHVVLDVAIPDDAKSQYLQDQKNNPDSFYILGNLSTDLFTIPSIAIGETNSFQADIFRGLPDDPNKDTPLIHNVKTEIRRIIRIRHFDFNQKYPENLTYVLFGDENEAFLSHYLTKQPDFMHTVKLKTVPDWLQSEQLKMGADINFLDKQGGKVPCESPLAEGSYKVMFQGQENTSVNIEVAGNIFFSTAVPNSKDPCSK
jgi:hypothetical protein